MDQAPLVNVAVDVVAHPLGAPATVLPTLLHLLRSQNDGMLDDTGVIPAEIEVGPTPAGIRWPRFEYNNIDVSAAQDPANKYFFAVASPGLSEPPHTTIWSHEAEARTIFPIQDIPARSGARCGGS
ncbi:MAG: hypothetical protein EPO21_14405 [Chloroflexota bacterium]|nr:MAG: hypothetical protein EPO21_14405 [Chloroflexota bacterium]